MTGALFRGNFCFTQLTGALIPGFQGDRQKVFIDR